MDTFELNGCTFEVEFINDEDSDPPWRNDCIFDGVVSDWTQSGKAPHHRVLCEDRGNYLYFDVKQYIKVALSHGCTRKQAAEQLEGSFDYLRRWCNDQWNYIGVVVHLLDEGGKRTEGNESLWGIASDQSEDIKETAQELAEQLLHVQAAKSATVEAVYANL